LPESYTGPIAGTPLRADLVPCGIAATENIQVVSENFDTDPRWCASPVRAHVREHGLCAVWSTPICTTRGDVLGTLCIYQRQPAIPLPHHQDIIARATHIASIAIERVRAEEALAKVRSDLTHVSRMMSLGALAASIAHEVNQPLSGIVTNGNTCLRMLALDPPNVEGALETVRRTIRDGNRASEVIARLRSLFQRKDFAADVVNVNQAAREVAALSAHDLGRRGIVLVTDLDDDLPEVFADRVQLQQVILNLILNAADALSAIERTDRRIVLSTIAEGDCVTLSVRDNGVGLDPDALGKVFDAFYTTKHDGMGIGLAVSRSIIERHQGKLWAAANEHGGATFSFALPSQLF
jgi:C4-dicarboxylate-specific signal transduction histidine kinase